MYNRLRELRKAKNVSMQTVADAINMSMSNLGSLERQETNLSAIDAYNLAKYYDVTIEYILGLEDINKQHPQIEVLAALKGDKLQVIKQISDMDQSQLHDLSLIIDILYNKK